MTNINENMQMPPEPESYQPPQATPSTQPIPPPPTIGSYQPPPPPVISSGSDQGIDSRIVESFGKTKPWVRFLSVLGFISVGLMILLSFFVMGVSLVADTAEFSPFEGMLLGFIYLFSAFLYFIPSVFLWKYASAIKHLKDLAISDNLFKVAESQRSFWKIMGIIAIVGLILSVIGFVVLIIVAIMTAASTM